MLEAHASAGLQVQVLLPWFASQLLLPSPTLPQARHLRFSRGINIRQQFCWVRELSWKVPGQKDLSPSSIPAGMRAARSKCCSPKASQHHTQTESKAPGQRFVPCLAFLLTDLQG